MGGRKQDGPLHTGQGQHLRQPCRSGIEGSGAFPARLPENQRLEADILNQVS